VGRHETAHLSYADVKLLDVRTAKYLTPPVSTDATVLASGVFVVVIVQMTATREPTTFSSTWLEDDDGRRYLPAVRAGCGLAPQLDTGVPTYAMLCYEVPAKRLEEYRLKLARGLQQDDGTRQDDVADLALDIDAGAGATRADTDAAYQVEDAGQRPFELRTVTIQGAS
jgi:hypothetical protein